MEIIAFDAEKCILTRELIPIDITEYRRFVQPIWVRNFTMNNIQFNFSSKERGIKIMNPNLTVPRQSVWPLMLEYRPSDEDNDVKLYNFYYNDYF